MKEKETLALYLITMVAVVLIALYGPPLVEFKTSGGTTFTIWGVMEIIPIFAIARKNQDK